MAKAMQWRSDKRRELFSWFGPRRFLANWLSVRVLRLAHRRTAALRLTLGAIVGVVWVVFGVWAAHDHAVRQMQSVQGAPAAQSRQLSSSPLDIFIVGASEGICSMRSGKSCDFDPEMKDRNVRLAQTALALLALLTLAFGFWTQLFGALAHALRALGGGHVVIAGDGGDAEALARDVTRKGQSGRKAAVIVRKHASDADISALAAEGVVLIPGQPSDRGVLRAAGIRAASRVLAMSPNASENIAAAAGVRRVRPRLDPGDLLVRIEDPHMRRDLTDLTHLRSADAFSLADIAARQLVREGDFLDLAARGKHPRVHVAIVGWDETSIAVAAALFRQMWAPQFAQPRVSVFAPEAEACEAQFKARYPRAFENDLWKADIAFFDYHWDKLEDAWAPFDSCAAERGPIAALVVSWPRISDSDDDATLRCAAVLAGRAGTRTEPPLFVRENPEGTIEQTVASGDLALRVTAFGGPRDVISARALVERSIDDAAKRVHESYIDTCVLGQNEDDYAERLKAKMGGEGGIVDLERAYEEKFGAEALEKLRRREADRLLAQGRFTPNPDRPAQAPWNNLRERYITANRTAADHALVKLWSLNWRPAGPGQRGATPEIGVSEISEALSNIEHLRWSADLFLTGWRFGETRDDAKMLHPDLRPYDAFASEKRPLAVAKDRDNWLTAPRVARAIHPRGFVKSA